MQAAQTAAQTVIGQRNNSAIIFFFVIVAITLYITYWAAKRTRSTKEFYAAGRTVSAFQNGLALSGDYMSAASFLGIAGIVALEGYDGMIYATGWLVGWPGLMFLIAGAVRIAAAIGGILTVLFYTIAQMVGAGSLIKLMFGIPYVYAELIVGAVMLAYVLFGVDVRDAEHQLDQADV